MFIGHYGVALGLKRAEKGAPLGWLFLATQLPDILLFSFTLLGIEHLNIVENFTPSTDFELVSVPYSHSLVGTILWALVVYLLWRILSPKSDPSRNRVAIALAAAVLSHWVLDLLVHTPDLPLLGNDSPKLGLGIWNNALITLSLETALLLAGAWVYLQGSRPTSAIGKFGIPLLVLFMIAANVYNIYGPPPANPVALAATSLMIYLTFGAIAFWLDRKRSFPAAHGSV
jgi:heme A synthase